MTLTPTRTNTGSTSEHQSPIVTVGTATTLGSVAETLNPYAPFNSCGVELFSDAAGATPATATAGTFTVQAKTPVNPQGLDAIADGAIDATALSTVYWYEAAIAVTVTPSGVTGDATHYRVNVHQRAS